MGLTLISATPSPYARKVRIALAEKSIPFTLESEVPWMHTTKTPQWNPLEQLPILILDDEGKSAIYDSRFILEYIETKWPDAKPLLSLNVDEKLLAKQIEVVVDGICDAVGRLFFESARGPEKESSEWKARQARKVVGGLKAIAGWAKAAREKGCDFLVGSEFGLADVAVVTLCGFLEVVKGMVQGTGVERWKEAYPELKEYFERVDERESCKETRPFMFELSEKVV